MTVHFIGAGPGAADLITLRAQRLIQRCSVIVYAGSLIPKEIVDLSASGARRIDSAPLSLDDLERVYVDAHGRGEDVARLHSGDLSVWSAMAEQIRRLQGHGIAYDVTPGVPAFAACAAALGAELTLPGVGQSLVLTRTSGRATAMPPAESLEVFAESGTTLAIHLSVHVVADVVRRLLPFYGASCPAAVVYRASWVDETVLRGALGTLEAQVADADVDRSALILVGPTLAQTGFDDSALYNSHYGRRYRGRAAPRGRARPAAEGPGRG